MLIQRFSDCFKLFFYNYCLHKMEMINYMILH